MGRRRFMGAVIPKFGQQGKGGEQEKAKRPTGGRILERWRRDRRLQPRYFEKPFGMNGSDSWPPLELDVGGVRVSFRGFIDRIDLDASGRRAYLYDYKTGSTTAYGDLNDDPVMAGKHIQLALYRRALLAALADVDDADGAYWFVTSRGEFKMLPAEMPPGTDRRLNQVLEGAQASFAPKSAARSSAATSNSSPIERPRESGLTAIVLICASPAISQKPT